MVTDSVNLPPYSETSSQPSYPVVPVRIPNAPVAPVAALPDLARSSNRQCRL